MELIHISALPSFPPPPTSKCLWLLCIFWCVVATIAFTVVGLFVVACVLYGIVAAVRNWNELVAEAERQDELRQEQAERKAFAWAQSSFRRDPPKRVLSREESYSYTPGFYRAAHPVFGGHGHNYSEPSRRREPSVQPFTADSYQTATPKVETNPSLRKEIAQAPHARPMSWADPNPAPEMPRPNLGLYRGSQWTWHSINISSRWSRGNHSTRLCGLLFSWVFVSHDHPLLRLQLALKSRLYIKSNAAKKNSTFGCNHFC